MVGPRAVPTSPQPADYGMPSDCEGHWTRSLATTPGEATSKCLPLDQGTTRADYGTKFASPPLTPSRGCTAHRLRSGCGPQCDLPYTEDGHDPRSRRAYRNTRSKTPRSRGFPGEIAAWRTVLSRGGIHRCDGPTCRRGSFPSLRTSAQGVLQLAAVESTPSKSKLVYCKSELVPSKSELVHRKSKLVYR